MRLNQIRRFVHKIYRKFFPMRRGPPLNFRATRAAIAVAFKAITERLHLFQRLRKCHQLPHLSAISFKISTQLNPVSSGYLMCWSAAV